MTAGYGLEAAMRRRCKIRFECRLTVIGSKREVQRFQASAWQKILRAQHMDPLEFSRCRFVCQFETPLNPLRSLQSLSRSQPGLTFLLDYEVNRIKGLAKAKAGELEHCEIGY
jgi:hypothetical protein